MALAVFGLSCITTEKLFALEVLAVSGNGKWALVYEPMANDFGPSVAKAEAECAAKGGTDIKIVWSQGSNTRWGHPAMAHGAIAISDNGTGTIVGWCFSVPYQNQRRAVKDCLKKGGRNPKVVASF